MTSASDVMTFENAATMGLSRDEWDLINQRLGRTPNLCELGIFSAMWSEHCSYKSSKKWLKTLPIDGPQVIEGPGENAGAVDIGDGLAAIFKIESHNHPSFIEPYQGAATGVGGILRDVFTMGARPVALLNALRFGAAEHEKTRHLVGGVVLGIGGYGNCIGIPTVGGEVNFDKSYNGNILVNAMAVGLANSDRIFRSAATGPGNPVIYVGAKTGRDGIHGATMASAEFSDETESKRPTVQVGDPFTGKLLMEACLELMASDSVLSIQDMGAAGLTSSSVEMASKGGLGMEIDLDLVPAREENMSAYELMLSESQERMLMVLKPDATETARAIFNKWDLDFMPIGRVTETGRLILLKDGGTACDIPIGPLVDDAPEYDRPHGDAPTRKQLASSDITNDAPITNMLKTMLGHVDLASRRWIYEQYDSQVMADTIAGPGGDAALVRVHGSKRGLAMSTDCTPRYVEADPKMGGAQAVAEAYRNLSAIGATPLAITNNLNFGNPEKPEIMTQLVESVLGMGDAARQLDTPVVSGNVSLYNETDGKAIQPCPVIGMVGVIENVDDAVGNCFVAADQDIFVIGQSDKADDGWLGASIYQQHHGDDGIYAPPPLDLVAEQKTSSFVRQQILGGGINAAHDIADGGLAVAIAEMAMRSGFGAEIAVPKTGNLHGWAFGEDQARFVVTTADSQALIAAAKEAGIDITKLGMVSDQGELKFGDNDTISIADLNAVFEGCIPALMAG
ncbi:phosphoribosylformylglycinamidine synthase subunit PurL [Alphaproteobacteria bacterium]|jgi:phosphoribosylformylglycinamidine synthase II|nr:phosphoribosylformylglycinamidine synthase subunit PurL [Alphaproteobacteria bacterium]